MSAQDQLLTIIYVIDKGDGFIFHFFCTVVVSPGVLSFWMVGINTILPEVGLRAKAKRCH